MPLSLAHTELQQKKHELELEINKLTSKAEIKANEYKELADSVTDINSRIQTLTANISDIQTFGDKTLEVIKNILIDAHKTVSSSDECVDRSFRIVKELDKQIDTQVLKLQSFQIEEKERREQLAKDVVTLDILKNDLTIYTNRLQEKYDALGLGKLIL